MKGDAILDNRAINTAVQSDSNGSFDRTEWMAGKWGVMVHWIYPSTKPISPPDPGPLTKQLAVSTLIYLLEMSKLPALSG